MINELRAIFRRCPSGSRFFSPRARVVLAVSGGVDSVVLLDLFLTLPATVRPQLIVAHVNHQLRAASDHEEATLRAWCQDRGLPLVVARWPRADHPARGIEAAARAFRYRFFARVMRDRGATALATAHHADDLAETFMMKLVRGGQLSQLVALRDARLFGSGTLIRPLLRVPKADLVAYAHERGLPWFEDASNQDLAMTRNRYRHEYLPALERENPRLVEEIGDYHQQLGDLLALAAPALASLDVRLLDQAGGLRLTGYDQLAPAIQRAYLRHWLAGRGVTAVKADQLAQAHHLLSLAGPAQGMVTLAAGWCLVRTYDRASVKKKPKIEPHRALENSDVVKLDRWYQRPGVESFGLWRATPPLSAGPLVWLTRDQWPLRRRPWRPGDRLPLKGGGHQRVSRILIDQKVARAVRKHQEVVVDRQGRVVWLVGRKVAWFPKRPAAVPVRLKLQAGRQREE